jgi:hypothetical protein
MLPDLDGSDADGFGQHIRRLCAKTHKKQKITLRSTLQVPLANQTPVR